MYPSMRQERVHYWELPPRNSEEPQKAAFIFQPFRLNEESAFQLCLREDHKEIMMRDER